MPPRSHETLRKITTITDGWIICGEYQLKIPEHWTEKPEIGDVVYFTQSDVFHHKTKPKV